MSHFFSNLRFSTLVASTALLAAISSFVAAIADDGGISFGGSPHLLNGHASVAMKSEVVTMEVHDKVVKVDCNFVFHNDGPECTVRMGFPDNGLGAAEPFQGEPLPKGKDLHATFLTYDSYVDGKKVPTELVPTDDRSLFWHTKTVTFKAKSDCNIRDVYTLPPGAQVTIENGMYMQTYYVLHTGASWHGPIGRAEVVVNFAPDSMKGPIRLKPVDELPNRDLLHMKWSQFPEGTVVYEGPCKPRIQGRTLRFVRSDFSPEKKDDIHLYYAFRLLHNM